MRASLNKTWWLVILVIVLGIAGFWGWRHFHEDHDHDHHGQHAHEEKQSPSPEHDHDQHDDQDHQDHAEKSELRPGEVRLSPEVMKQAGIETVPVLSGPLGIMTSFTGELVFNEERLARIHSRVSGRVVQILADYGTSVKTGQALAVIDSVELGQARMASQQAAAKFHAAQQAYDRAVQLYEGKAISRAELQERQARLEVERAELDQTRNHLRLLGAGGAAAASPQGSGSVKTTSAAVSGALFRLRTPISGRIVDRQITPGLMVKEDAELFTVADTSSLWCFVQIPDKDLASVRVGSRAAITVSSLSGEEFPGRVDYLADTVDKATRTIRGRVRVDNPQNRLKAGMFANIAIRAGERRALSVPQSAVLNAHGEYFVFVEMAPGAFVKHLIKPGMRGAGRVEVLDGLDPDEPVVFKGAFTLKSELEKSGSRGGLGGGHGHAH